MLEEAVIATLCRELSKKEPIDFITKEIQCNLDDFIQGTLRDTQKHIVEEELKTATHDLDNMARAIMMGIITETTESSLREAEIRKKRLQVLRPSNSEPILGVLFPHNRYRF